MAESGEERDLPELDEYLTSSLTVGQVDQIRLHSVALFNRFGMALIHMDHERIVWRDLYGNPKSISLDEWPQLEKELCRQDNQFQGSL